MYFLAHTAHRDKIDVDFYTAPTDVESVKIEYELIKSYMSQHGELPPLNFGMK